MRASYKLCLILLEFIFRCWNFVKTKKLREGELHNCKAKTLTALTIGATFLYRKVPIILRKW